MLIQFMTSFFTSNDSYWGGSVHLYVLHVSEFVFKKNENHISFLQRDHEGFVGRCLDLIVYRLFCLFSFLHFLSE